MTTIFLPRQKTIFIFITTVLLGCFMHSVSAQILEYDIIKGDKKVGSLRAEKRIVGDSMFYSIESETSIKMLLTFKVNYRLDELYVGGRLISGAAESQLNGNSRTKSEIWIENNEYIVEVNGYKESMGTDPITYSVPEVYFSVPGDREETFSQQFAQYLTLKKDEKFVYTLYSEDGRNTHTYVNGICTFVKLNRTYASFYFRLKQ
ncbi:MAG: DUF6134 family protein [Reichenbachiella sp.]|uniref:DUF6134 family protein n=1 Tax=Reichenbachiella sp. TaxID=2184521 RepID=UPI0032677FA6